MRKQLTLGETVKSRDILAHNLEINWALIVMNHMFGVSTTSESKITLNARDSKIDVDVIHKMGFFRDLTDIIYKHQSDKPVAPVDPTTNVSINPPTQQPSDFHTESSSSAYMPSNQMIMDNQLLQLELQRLSYKINRMNLDEDSSEPES
ncbi:hypothetical protein Lal_00015466 [Lupinus albus]|nr:hypothetical protein Lal_00015466 [Lupinus albus]